MSRLRNLVIISLLLVLTKNVSSVRKNPVLLISLDGFRADKLDQFLNENPNSNLKSIADKGVRAEFMKPSFPSSTFPNHWTLVTGLYPESHGIVGNRIYDPATNQMINLLGDPNSLEPQWWNQTEPIWLTAKQQGLKTAASFWPGSEVWPRTPDIFLPFNKKHSYKMRIDEVINWFEKFDLDFACLYFDQPDSEGHSYGPDSSEYAEMILRMDMEIGYLVSGLKMKKLFEKINIIIVSDHGMSQVKSISDYIAINEFLNMDRIDKNKTIYGEVSHIYTTSKNDENDVYLILDKIPNMKTYLNDNIPDEFHFKANDRIGPIVVIAEEGYYLTAYPNGFYTGHHGYNNSLVSMRTIFMALGPDFKSNKKIPSFENVEVYGVICELLQIKCHTSNTSNVLRTHALNNSTRLSSILVWFGIAAVIISKRL